MSDDGELESLPVVWKAHATTFAEIDGLILPEGHSVTGGSLVAARLRHHVDSHLQLAYCLIQLFHASVVLL